MGPARPRLLGHLRDMLYEKEQDLAVLQRRLQESEKLHEEAVVRLECLEQKFVLEPDSNLESRMQALGAVETAQATEDNHTIVAVDSGGDLRMELRCANERVDELQHQLCVSEAARAAIANECDRWRNEANMLQGEVDSLRKFANSERSSREIAAREMEVARSRLTAAVSEASVLRSQLTSRQADVARLEKRLAEVEGWQFGQFPERDISGLPSDRDPNGDRPPQGEARKDSQGTATQPGTDGRKPWAWTPPPNRCERHQVPVAHQPPKMHRTASHGELGAQPPQAYQAQPQPPKTPQSQPQSQSQAQAQTQVQYTPNAQRSQSVPVQRSHYGHLSPTPGTVLTSSGVSLARWAASPISSRSCEPAPGAVPRLEQRCAPVVVRR